MKELQITKRAIKDLSKLDKNVARQVLITLDNFVSNPEAVDIRKLRYKRNLWRIRMGDYRIIIKMYKKTIFVEMIGHRKDIYKKLKR